MKKLVRLDSFGSNLRLIYKQDNSTEIELLNYCGLQGELSKKEWLQDELIASYDEEDQRDILIALGNTTENFFG